MSKHFFFNNLQISSLEEAMRQKDCLISNIKDGEFKVHLLFGSLHFAHIFSSMLLNFKIELRKYKAINEYIQLTGIQTLNKILYLTCH